VRKEGRREEESRFRQRQSRNVNPGVSFSIRDDRDLQNLIFNQERASLQLFLSPALIAFHCLEDVKRAIPSIIPM